MTCPHCAAGFLPDNAHRCPMCGQLPGRPTKPTFAVAEPPAAEPPAEDYGAVDELIGKELGAQFQIERPLKHGRTSHVYFARDTARGSGGGREAALKVILPPAGATPADVERFQHAAQTAAGLDHPHVVRPYRYGTTDTLWWYAMEYVPAPSVAQRLAEGAGTPLDVPLTWRIAQQLASALDYAHRRGVVHGALTPRDVLLDDAGWVRVVDVGLAQGLRGDEDAGPLVDQYSLALVVRECLTGVPPQAGTPDSPELPAAAGPHVAQVLQRATARMPGDRFLGVLDFVAALEGGQAASRPFGFAGRTPPRGPRRPVLLFEPETPPRRSRLYRVGVVLALMLTGGALWISGQTDGGAPISALEPVAAAPEPALEAPAPAPPPPPVAPAAPAAPAAPRPRPATPPPRRQPVRAATLAPEPGYLSVNSLPWALLSVDGRMIGTTPRVKVRLPAGVHHLRLQREGFRPYEAAVEVKSGETVLITNITLTTNSP